MSVGSISSGLQSQSLQQFQNFRVQGQGQGTQGAPPAPPKELQEKIQSLKDGGATDEQIGAELKKGFEEFQKSDTFKQLPSQVQDQLKSFNAQPFAQLQQKGQSLQADLLSQLTSSLDSNSDKDDSKKSSSLSFNGKSEGGNYNVDLSSLLEKFSGVAAE